MLQSEARMAKLGGGLSSESLLKQKIYVEPDFFRIGALHSHAKSEFPWPKEGYAEAPKGGGH